MDALVTMALSVESCEGEAEIPESSDQEEQQQTVTEKTKIKSTPIASQDDETDIAVSSLKSCDLAGKTAEEAAPSFSLTQEPFRETGRMVYQVYENGATGSDTEVVIKVVSLTPLDESQQGEQAAAAGTALPESETGPVDEESGAVDGPTTSDKNDRITEVEEESQEEQEADGEAENGRRKKRGKYSCENDRMTEVEEENQEEEEEADGEAENGRCKKRAKYSCEICCDFTTSKKHVFLAHQVLHAVPDDQQLFHCSECSHSTRQRFNLKTHVRRHMEASEMDDSDLFKCPECSYTTLYKHDLMTHSKKHDPEKQYRCFHCSFTSIYSHSLIQHISSKHQGKRPYRCTLCPYAAARKQDLETHMYKHSKQKRYKCTVCEYETQYRQSLKSHMNAHEGNRPFECKFPTCSYTTTSRGNLKCHIARHEKRVHCSTCGFETTKEKKLAKHVCTGSIDNGKCVERTQRVGTVDPLPLENEDGSLEYRCTECEYKTSSKHCLKRHSKRHNPSRQTPDKTHECPHCEYKTAYKNSLKRHMARHSLVKPFKCGHCDYSAINMSQMHTHIAKHTGVKPFICEVCNYATANKQHLTNHMAKHSNLRYKCNMCGHMTAWKDRMRFHLKQHAQGRIVAPPSTVKSTSSNPVNTSPLKLIPSEEDGRFYALTGSGGKVLHVIAVEENALEENAEDQMPQRTEESNTMVAIDNLADRIAEEFRTISQGEEEGQSGAQGQEAGQETAEPSHASGSNQEEEDAFAEHVVITCQDDVEEGTLVIVSDHQGVEMDLLSSNSQQSLQSSTTGSMQEGAEGLIMATQVEKADLPSQVAEVPGEAS